MPGQGKLVHLMDPDKTLQKKISTKLQPGGISEFSRLSQGLPCPCFLPPVVTQLRGGPLLISLLSPEHFPEGHNSGLRTWGEGMGSEDVPCVLLGEKTYPRSDEKAAIWAGALLCVQCHQPRPVDSAVMT